MSSADAVIDRLRKDIQDKAAEIERLTKENEGLVRLLKYAHEALFEEGES